MITIYPKKAMDTNHLKAILGVDIKRLANPNICDQIFNKSCYHSQQFLAFITVYMRFFRDALMVFCNVLMIVATSSEAKQIEVELLADKNYPPYSYLENDVLKGVYIDIVKEAFSALPAYRLKLTAMHRTEARQRIKNGLSLGIIGTYFHGHDLPYIYPYSLALGKEAVVTVCHANALGVPRKKWPEDYKSLLMGNVLGYDGWLNYQVRSEGQTKNVNFLEVPTTQIALDMVSQARLDCTLFNEATFYFSQGNDYQQTTNTKGGTKQVAIGTRVSTKIAHIGYSRKAIKENRFPYAFELQHGLDVAIFKLEESGDADKIRKKYTSIPLSPVN